MEFFRQTTFTKSFSTSLDCDSLFTTGMLMALFAVAILLAIVFFGIIMVMSIQVTTCIHSELLYSIHVNEYSVYS